MDGGGAQWTAIDPCVGLFSRCASRSNAAGSWPHCGPVVRTSFVGACALVAAGTRRGVAAHCPTQATARVYARIAASTRRGVIGM